MMYSWVNIICSDPTAVEGMDNFFFWKRTFTLPVMCMVFIDRSSLTSQKIEDFHPRKSIVVTPDKMAEFYTNYSVEDEVYPLISKKEHRY